MCATNPTHVVLESMKISGSDAYQFYQYCIKNTYLLTLILDEKINDTIDPMPFVRDLLLGYVG